MYLKVDVFLVKQSEPANKLSQAKPPEANWSPAVLIVVMDWNGELRIRPCRSERTLFPGRYFHVVDVWMYRLS